MLQESDTGDTAPVIIPFKYAAGPRALLVNARINGKPAVLIV
jgi:hypothetical protein